MTAQEVYQHYLLWVGGEEPLDFSEFLRHPLVDRDVFEDGRWVVNRLYYLVPGFVRGTLRCFVFFEENEFCKDERGDLWLVRSKYHLGKGIE